MGTVLGVLKALGTPSLSSASVCLSRHCDRGQASRTLVDTQKGPVLRDLPSQKGQSQVLFRKLRNTCWAFTQMA